MEQSDNHIRCSTLISKKEVCSVQVSVFFLPETRNLTSFFLTPETFFPTPEPQILKNKTK
jgi:hypothetical protein